MTVLILKQSEYKRQFWDPDVTIISGFKCIIIVTVEENYKEQFYNEENNENFLNSERTNSMLDKLIHIERHYLVKGYEF